MRAGKIAGDRHHEVPFLECLHRTIVLFGREKTSYRALHVERTTGERGKVRELLRPWEVIAERPEVDGRAGSRERVDEMAEHPALLGAECKTVCLDELVFDLLIRSRALRRVA